MVGLVLCTLDCAVAPGTCKIGVGVLNNYSINASASIDFDPSARARRSAVGDNNEITERNNQSNVLLRAEARDREVDDRGVRGGHRVEERVHHVQVVELVGFAVAIEYRSLGIVAPAHAGLDVVGAAISRIDMHDVGGTDVDAVSASIAPCHVDERKRGPSPGIRFASNHHERCSTLSA